MDNSIAVAWIKRRREQSMEWDTIHLAKKSNNEELLNFLRFQHENNDWPLLGLDEWHALVNEQLEIEQKLADAHSAAILMSENEDNGLTVPIEDGSAWQCYKKRLLDQGFSLTSLENMEKSTIATLKHLSLDTSNRDAVKGMVMGNVQSGKTANMAALMAMAADYGWNMFVILSGTKENLRQQTMARLFRDLTNQECDLNWGSIDNPEQQEAHGKRPEHKNFRENSNIRYISVCLKQKTRLENLIGWLRMHHPTQGLMKVLVIDDEADQASINTNAQNPRNARNNNDELDPTVINGLIKQLVNQIDSEGNAIANRFLAMNYIGYTATPYANVLNEVERDSLYPRHFISYLNTPAEYFGPQQIFGCQDNPEFNGLDIIRNVPDTDVSDIKEIQNGKTDVLPSSLRDALFWFICSIACMRKWQYAKPISMLIHASRLTSDHRKIESAVRKWFQETPKREILDGCRKIWEYETSRLSLEDFRHQFPSYEENCASEINDYPAFDDIKQNIIYILEHGLTNIGIDRTGRCRYRAGIHLCVDNSENARPGRNGATRLVYPESNDAPRPAPAFLVIGGDTLSRGLTLEGLVSTYFLRVTKTADNLMQMGRWFGYRKGYELMPRIWMTKRTAELYEFISRVDYNLRKEVVEMSAMGRRPIEYAPRLMSHPSASVLRIVAANRMQSAATVEFDFSGHSTETGVFDNDEVKLRENLQRAAEFIRSMGEADIRDDENPHAKNAYVWRNIEFEQVKNFVSQFHYSERQRAFNDLNPMLEWIEDMTAKGNLSSWNVILAGKSSDEMDRAWEPAEGVKIGMIQRSRRYEVSTDNAIRIGALRSPKDFLADIKMENVSEKTRREIGSFREHKTREIQKFRQEAGLGRTPQLFIYVIDKDSKAAANSNRYDLNAEEDVIGLSINIPGERSASTTVRIAADIPEVESEL